MRVPGHYDTEQSKPVADGIHSPSAETASVIDVAKKTQDAAEDGTPEPTPPPTPAVADDVEATEPPPVPETDVEPTPPPPVPETEVEPTDPPPVGEGDAEEMDPPPVADGTEHPGDEGDDDDLEDMSREELYDEATELDISGRSSMTKDELKEAVKKARKDK